MHKARHGNKALTWHLSMGHLDPGALGQRIRQQHRIAKPIKSSQALQHSKRVSREYISPAIQQPPQPRPGKRQGLTTQIIAFGDHQMTGLIPKRAATEDVGATKHRKHPLRPIGSAAATQQFGLRPSYRLHTPTPNRPWREGDEGPTQAEDRFHRQPMQSSLGGKKQRPSRRDLRAKIGVDQTNGEFMHNRLVWQQRHQPHPPAHGQIPLSREQGHFLSPSCPQMRKHHPKIVAHLRRVSIASTNDLASCPGS